jgi:putative ATPase
MRGSDPDAAIHYLARMIVAGEDVNFIARRIAICAAEDVGNADPMALVVAMAAVQAVQFIGLPEARIPLAQAVTYIASAPKSNAAYLSIDSALQDVRTRDCGAIPLHLKDAHYKGAEKLGHGIDYKYPHDFNDHFIKQQYLPTKIMGKKYYDPTSNGHEKIIKQYLATHQNFLPK